jgi:quercetin dioxygenase-like cupin family protein
MPVIDQTRPQPTPIPGIAHSTWAGRDDGLEQLSVWRQTLAPGAATPPHRHDCDEVALCVSGWGELHEEGQAPRRFGPDHTVVLQRGRMHQLFTSGDTPLELIGVFAATPVRAILPDGEELALPWRS